MGNCKGDYDSMRMTLRQWMAENDYDTIEDVIEEFGIDDISYPALCTKGCYVESDGTCPHGAPSILLAMGVSFLRVSSKLL